MKLFKHKENPKIFGIDGFTDDELIAHYNICLNYRAYLSQIMQLPNSTLLTLAPGNDAREVRNNLAAQKKACDNYIDMWKETIEKGGTKHITN